LQRRHRAKHERLWSEERLRSEERRRIEQRCRIERRREHVVDPTLSGATAIQRIVQLSKTKPRPNITARYH